MFQNAELTVREYLDMLRRRRWFIAAVTLAITALAVVPLTLSDPIYASTSEIQLRSETAVSAFGDDVPESELTRSRSLATDVAVIETSEMEALVIERLGRDGKEFDQVVAAVDGFTEIIQITAVAPTAAGASEAANAYADVYVEQRRDASTSALVAQESELRSQAQDLEVQLNALDAELAASVDDPLSVENIRQQRALLSTQISQYETRADQLGVDADLRENAYSVVARAPLNTTPVAPKPLRSGVIAFVIGLVVSVCMAVFLEVLRDRVSTVDDLESVDADLSVLASVPHVEIDLDDPDHRLPPLALESFRFLRTAIRFRTMDSAGQTVLITSATSSEGKTTTAVNLGLVMAEAGSRVVLIDADMRKPAVHDRLGVANRRGLGAVLNGDCSFADALRFVRPNLAVMTAGAPSAAATDLLGDDRFGRMIDAVREQCDIVIVDAPPVLPVADALLAARVVDNSIIVGRLGQVRRRELRATIRQFRDAYLPVMGLLANDSEVGSRYGVYYEPYGSTGDGVDTEPANV